MEFQIRSLLSLDTIHHHEPYWGSRRGGKDDTALYWADDPRPPILCCLKPSQIQAQMYSWNNISSVNRIETQFRSVANGLASRRADEDKMTTYSNKKMRENLGKSIDEKKLQTMMELKRAYNAGEITLEEGRKRATANS